MTKTKAPVLTLTPATRKERRERLTLLANHLAGLPDEKKFNMNIVGRAEGVKKKPSTFDCGSAACAMGHAPGCPPLYAAGLRMEWANIASSGPKYFVGTLKFAGTVIDGSPDGYYEVEEYDDFDVARLFFGLTANEANAVFAGWTNDRGSVIRALRYLAKNAPSDAFTTYDFLPAAERAARAAYDAEYPGS